MTKIDYTKLGYSTDVEPVTIDVRVSLPIKQHGQATVYAPVSKFPKAMLEMALHEGLKRVLNDGVGAKELSDADKVAKQSKRLDAMLAGSWQITEREASLQSLMREALYKDLLAGAPGTSDAKLEKDLKAKVKEVLGQKENATVDNILQVLAIDIAAAGHETRSVAAIKLLLDDKYVAAAQALAAERAKAGAGIKIDVASLKLV